MEKQKKTGLVLEGGGMRGLYTAGVLDVFMEHGITFDGVIGVSAGAIHGCSYVSGQRGRSLRYYKKYGGDKRFMSYSNFLRTGDLVDEKFCYHELPEKLDPYDYDGFSASKTEFYVGCSNLETGKAEYIRIEDMRKEIDFMRASASLPYVSRIVSAGGMKLLDGGCTDSIPLLAFRKMGFDPCVVILTREEGYVKKAEKKGLARLVYRKYPRFVRALENRPFVYNRTLQKIAALKEKGKIFVIQPKTPLSIGRMSHEEREMEETYQRGRTDGEASVTAMELWLSEKLGRRTSDGT